MFEIKPFFGFVFRVLIEPKSKNEDNARREFILNIFLVTSIALLSVALFLSLVFIVIFGALNQGDSLLYVGAIFLSFVALLLLSRLGFSEAVSYIFIAIFFLAIVRGIYVFGIDEPQTLLGFALFIVITGVLAGSRSAFFVTFLSILFIITLGYAQINKWYTVKTYWKLQAGPNIDNPIMFSITLGIIAVAAWLSNREIEKSLTRARQSEADLKKERDSLEITVEQRTRELKETQAEKVTQLYRFAEFGRLSSGLFHDLINPLTAVSLNMEKIKNAKASKHINRAVVAAKKMENMVSVVRKQLAREESKTLFSLNTETRDVIQMLTHRAQKSNISMKFSESEDIKFYGDAIKFNQIMMNLIANAIDAYVLKTDRWRDVLVSLRSIGDTVEISVRDYGVGITAENLAKIFDPFFTTKGHEQGTGIGLSITKRLVEKDFDGSIEVTSSAGKGSVFRVRFPIKTHD